MKRLGMLLFGALWLVTFSGWSETPDQMYIRVYNLVQQADALKTNGQNLDAALKYQEALKALDELEKQYPYWQRRVVEFRRGYIEGQLATLPKPPTGGSAASTTPQPEAQPEELLPTPQEVATLREQIRQLQAERVQLEARLREALTARPAVPAAGDTALQEARQRIQELEQENARLKAEIARLSQAQAATPTPTPTPTPPPAPAAPSDEQAKALEQARKAVADLSRELEDYKQRLATVEAERDALRRQLEQAQAQTATQPTAPAVQVQPQPPVQPAADQAELQKARRQIEELSRQLQAEKSRVESLEKQLAEAQKAAAKPAKEELALRQRIQDLENERESLLRRVTALTRQVDELKAASSDEAARQLSEQLQVLRARIQVYEAQAVPFTPEEMALMKTEPSTRGLRDTERLPATELPAGVAALISDAERAFRAGRYEEAEAKYLQALSGSGDNVHLLANLAACQLQQDKLTAAEQTLRRALAVDPNDPDALSLQGLLEFRLERYDAAEATLSKAAQLNPDSALTQNYLGVVLSQKGHRKAAETAFRRAIQIDPGYAEAHYNLAVLYAHQRPTFPALARYHYEKAVAAGQPRNPELERLLDEAAKE